MSRHTKHRKDGNHDRLVEELKAQGWHVIDTSQTGIGFDALAAKWGRLVPLEIKDGSLSPSRRMLTPHEQQVHAALLAKGVRVEILTSSEDLAILGREMRGIRDE